MPRRRRQIALAGVVAAAADGAARIVALRCSELAEDDLTVRAAKITALEVGTITGP